MLSYKLFISHVTCAILVLCMMGCKSKHSPVNRLEYLTVEIQENAQNYTKEDWVTLIEELELIESEIEQYKSEYTDEELKEIGRLKGQCLAQFTKYSMETFKNGLIDVLKEAEGLIEGFTQEFDDNERE